MIMLYRCENISQVYAQVFFVTMKEVASLVTQSLVYIRVGFCPSLYALSTWKQKLKSYLFAQRRTLCPTLVPLHDSQTQDLLVVGLSYVGDGVHRHGATLTYYTRQR